MKLQRQINKTDNQEANELINIAQEKANLSQIKAFLSLYKHKAETICITYNKFFCRVTEKNGQQIALFTETTL